MTDSHRYQSGSTTMTQDRDSGNALAERRRRALHSHFAVTQGGDRRPGRRGVGVAGSIVSSDLQPIQRCGCQAACCPCRSHIGGQAASGAAHARTRWESKPIGACILTGLFTPCWAKSLAHLFTSPNIPERPRKLTKSNEDQRKATKIPAHPYTNVEPQFPTRKPLCRWDLHRCISSSRILWGRHRVGLDEYRQGIEIKRLTHRGEACRED